MRANTRRHAGIWHSLTAILAPLAIALAAPGAAQAPARPVPPSIALGELFERVALSGLFPDGKRWADATPRAAPAAILDAYRRERPETETELRRFVDAHFAFDAPAEVRLPPAGLPLAAHIERLWPILTRSSTAPAAHSSLLALPHPYAVPGGRFTEIYYWDSYFTMLGFGPGQAALRRHMVDNFAHLIRTYGHIPNGNRSYYLSRSQPPLFFKMVELTDPARPGRAFARYLPELRAEHRWWMAGEAQARIGHPVGHVVRLPGGSVLNRYWDARDVPRDESYRADAEAAAGVADKHALYRNLRAAAESGWDFSSRWMADGRTLATTRTTELVPPDLNSLLYGLERAIERGCAEARDRACVREFARRARARAAAIHARLWNEETGAFDDYDWKRRRLAGNVSAATLYPLFVGLATRAEADRVAATAERALLRPGGLATTGRATGQQWDSPNGWAPLQWIAVQGLRAYRHDALAGTIARRWLTTVTRVYAVTGKLLEKYDVVTPRPGGGGEYPLQDGFGWTNGVTAALLRSYRPESRQAPDAKPKPAGVPQ